MKKPELTKTETKNQYELKIRSFADDLDEKISKAENRMKELTDNAKTEYASRLDHLKNKRQQLSDHIDEVRKAREDEWKEIRTNFQSRAEALSHEIAEAYDGISAGLDYLFKKLRNR